MKRFRKIKFILEIIVIPVFILYLLIYLINYFPQILAFILSQLGKTVDKSNFNNIDGLTFLALFLSMIGIAVSIILTYVVFITSKNKTNNEFNNFREIAYIQTLSSLEMIYRNKFTSIQSVDKYIDDSYRFKPIFADQEFQLLLKIWESILSIKSLSGELRMEKCKDHNHLIFHPIVTLLKREYPQLLIQASDVTTLLSKETINILNKLNPQKDKSIVYSSRLYENNKVFLSFRDIKGIEMITVLNIDGQQIYEGTLNNGVKFSGHGKFTSPISRKMSLKHFIRSYYIGQLKDEVPDGLGIEYAKNVSVEFKNDKWTKDEDIDVAENDLKLKDGTWNEGEFVEGTLFNVRMIDNKHPILPIVHAIQDEKLIGDNLTIEETVLGILGELSLHDKTYTVRKVTSFSEIDSEKKMEKTINAALNFMHSIK